MLVFFRLQLFQGLLKWAASALISSYSSLIDQSPSGPRRTPWIQRLSIASDMQPVLVPGSIYLSFRRTRQRNSHFLTISLCNRHWSYLTRTLDSCIDFSRCVSSLSILSIICLVRIDWISFGRANSWLACSEGNWRVQAHAAHFVIYHLVSILSTFSQLEIW